MNFLTKGTITAGFSVLAILAGVSGHPLLATFFNDPTTAQNVLVAIGSLGALAAGAMKGIHQVAPAPVAPVKK